MVRTIKLSLITVFFLTTLLPSHVLGITKILNIRHWTAPDHTRIVVDTSNEVKYSVDQKDKKVLIVFKDASAVKTIPHEILIKKLEGAKINLFLLPERDIRIEISLPENVVTNVFMLKKFQDKPDRVVVDVFLPDVEKIESQEREQIKVSRKDMVIVIDPGHGGEDPGAIGKYGTHEKNIVLSIGKKVKDNLNKRKGYRAFMTREGDYYVPFKKRTKIAREYGADLFLSVHADAARNRRAKGSSVYCFSFGGVSSEAAKILARNENLADLIGGSPNGDNSDESDPIILNMFQTNTINMSKTFGRNLLKHLNGIGKLKFINVQEAPFRVLKLPEIPSVLIETAYVSNPKEEHLLRNHKFQSAVAEAIGNSTVEFLSISPSVEVVKNDKAIKEPVKSMSGTRDRLQVVKKTDIIVYRVKKGDSLDKIARNHGTAVGTLLKLNRIKLDNPLFIGRPLRIPKTEIDSRRRGKPYTYTIKKGDTIDIIARRNKIKVKNILDLNNMKRKDILFTGQKIKLPQKSSH